MRLLVLGATGFIGPAVLRAARAAGVEALGVARSPGSAGDNEGLFAADRRDPAAIAALVARERIDVLVDVLAYTEADTLPLLDALAGGLERYVLLSSADVYANYGLLQGTETGSARRRLDEGAPLRVGRYPYRGAQPRQRGDADAWRDAYDKIPLEEALRASSLAGTILRLPMVYGPGDRQRRFRWALGPLLGGASRLAVPRAWADWITTFGFVENVGAAVVHAALHAGARDGTFNVGEVEPVKQGAWARRFAARLGMELELLHDEASPLAERIAALDLRVPLDLDSSRLHEGLGFVAPVSLEAALDATIASERGR